MPCSGEWGARSAIRSGSRLLPYAAYKAMVHSVRIRAGRSGANSPARRLRARGVGDNGSVSGFQRSARRVVVLGGGPGGYEAALVAAQLGADVTVVERDGPGGAAVLTDVVPSKTLIATAEVMTLVDESVELGVRFPGNRAKGTSSTEPEGAVCVDLS